MSVLHRTRAPAHLSDTGMSTGDRATRRVMPVPRTRAGAAWIGVCAAALMSIVFIVFMLQNTRRVEVSFLWMHGTLPLALALLIAGIGVAAVAVVIGTARITQLRRLSRRH
jgi:putative membrane protein